MSKKSQSEIEHGVSYTQKFRKDRQFEYDNIKYALKKAFIPEKVSRYEIYDAFIGSIYERGLKKLMLSRDTSRGPISQEDILNDLDKYSMNLALRMSKKGICQVVYENKGTLFREESEWDVFFKFEKGSTNKFILSA